MKTLAIIGSGRMGWIIGKNAKELGLQTICFSNIEQDFLSECIDCFYNISIFDVDNIVGICRDQQINGVIATTELTVSVAAYVAKQLNLVGISYDVSICITDKNRNRLCCMNQSLLKQPTFTEVFNKQDFEQYSFKYPVIIKPVAKGGKRGITVVNDHQRLLEAFDFAKKQSAENPVIVEEYLQEGTEYSVESLSYKGKHYVIQITEKITSGPPHCVELGHHQPAKLSDDMVKKVETSVVSGLNAIGLDNSSCHTEVKIIANEVYLIEFNARPGGDHISWPLVDLSTGYHYIQGAIKIALGEFEDVDKSKFKHNYAGVYFVTQQSAHLKPIFDVCDKYDWLYHKNYISDELVSLENNNCYSVNSIMYFSKEKRIEL